MVFLHQQCFLCMEQLYNSLEYHASVLLSNSQCALLGILPSRSVYYGDDHVIISVNNEEIKMVNKLKMRRYREETGLFVVEGSHLIEMGLDAAADFGSVFITEGFAASISGKRLLARFEALGTEQIMVTERVFKKISDTDSPPGILALVKMLSETEWKADMIKGSGPIVILDRIQDPGNLGTILRTADAAGAEMVLLLKGTVDVYNSKTVRSSMGSIFNVNFQQNMSDEACFCLLKGMNFKIVAADMSGERLYYEENLTDRVALVLGSEGHGLSSFWQKNVNVRVRIPLVGKAESLNVSVASGILLYEVVRQSQQGT